MMEEDCSLVFTTSRGQVKIAPTVPPHLEGSRAGVEDERVQKREINMVRKNTSLCFSIHKGQRREGGTGQIVLPFKVSLNILKC